MKDTYENSFSFFEKKYDKITNANKSLILAAYELKTPENMGSIIRLAANLNAKKVFFIHENFVVKESKLKRVAHSSIGDIDYEIVTIDTFWDKIETDYQIVALETTSLSQNIFNTSLPEKCLLMCGNERFGLPNSIIKKCNQSVFIPMPGSTRSMNVSHALTIAAFEWSRQHRAEDMMID